jgi:hypothetical protein
MTNTVQVTAAENLLMYQPNVDRHFTLKPIHKVGA